MSDIVEPTEAEVRALRDRIYGPQTDKEWHGAAKEHWMKPEEVAWLREQKENNQP